MNRHPLTDPTSLIAYRLAHRASSRSKQPGREVPLRKPRATPARGEPSAMLLASLFGAALVAGVLFTMVVLRP